MSSLIFEANNDNNDEQACLEWTWAGPLYGTNSEILAQFLPKSLAAMMMMLSSFASKWPRRIPFFADKVQRW